MNKCPKIISGYKNFRAETSSAESEMNSDQIKLGGARSAKRLPRKNWVISLE